MYMNKETILNEYQLEPGPHHRRPDTGFASLLDIEKMPVQNVEFIMLSSFIGMKYASLKQRVSSLLA